jgi:hypothetical protein
MRVGVHERRQRRLVVDRTSRRQSKRFSRFPTTPQQERSCFRFPDGAQPAHLSRSVRFLICKAMLESVSRTFLIDEGTSGGELRQESHNNGLRPCYRQDHFELGLAIGRVSRAGLVFGHDYLDRMSPQRLQQRDGGSARNREHAIDPFQYEQLGEQVGNSHTGRDEHVLCRNEPGLPTRAFRPFSGTFWAGVTEGDVQLTSRGDARYDTHPGGNQVCPVSQSMWRSLTLLAATSMWPSTIGS